MHLTGRTHAVLIGALRSPGRLADGIIFLGTGAPLHVSRATTGMLIRAEGCAPLLIDTCGGFELARSLSSTGFPLAQIHNVVVRVADVLEVCDAMRR